MILLKNPTAKQFQDNAKMMSVSHYMGEVENGNSDANVESPFMTSMRELGEMHKKERIDLILERIWPCPLSHAKMPNAVNTTYNTLLMLGVDCQEERIWSTKQCVTSRNPSAH